MEASVEVRLREIDRRYAMDQRRADQTHERPAVSDVRDPNSSCLVQPRPSLSNPNENVVNGTRRPCGIAPARPFTSALYEASGRSERTERAEATRAGSGGRGDLHLHVARGDARRRDLLRAGAALLITSFFVITCAAACSGAIGQVQPRADDGDVEVLVLLGSVRTGERRRESSAEVVVVVDVGVVADGVVAAPLVAPRAVIAALELGVVID